MAIARTEEETVAYEMRDNIAWMRFNRPEKRNCINPRLNRQMLRVIESLEFHDDVGVLVLTGAGEAWSVGMDLKEYFRDNEEAGLSATRQAQREAYAWWERLRWYEKPTIAMASSGIGLATAERIVALGGKVTLIARRSDKLEKACFSMPGPAVRLRRSPILPTKLLTRCSPST